MWPFVHGQHRLRTRIRSLNSAPPTNLNILQPSLYTSTLDPNANGPQLALPVGYVPPPLDFGGRQLAGPAGQVADHDTGNFMPPFMYSPEGDPAQLCRVSAASNGPVPASVDPRLTVYTTVARPYPATGQVPPRCPASGTTLDPSGRQLAGPAGHVADRDAGRYMPPFMFDNRYMGYQGLTVPDQPSSSSEALPIGTGNDDGPLRSYYAECQDNYRVYPSPANFGMQGRMQYYEQSPPRIITPIPRSEPVTAARPHKCQSPGCNRSFMRKLDLSRHCREVHENQQPHRCDRCEKTFKRKYQLKKHQLIHKSIPSSISGTSV